ncbi:MAG: hypothetical protein HZB67_01585 [Candidatus Aenigmarchaeota archaeon]|nr:hypothetical protein [Candidatus Aenigmarchaeota archaeon]
MKSFSRDFTRTDSTDNMLGRLDNVLRSSLRVKRRGHHEVVRDKYNSRTGRIDIDIPYCFVSDDTGKIVCETIRSFYREENFTVSGEEYLIEARRGREHYLISIINCGPVIDIAIL